MSGECESQKLLLWFEAVGGLCLLLISTLLLVLTVEAVENLRAQRRLAEVRGEGREAEGTEEVEREERQGGVSGTSPRGAATPAARRGRPR